MNSKINVQPLFSEPRKIVDEFAVGEDEDSCSKFIYINLGSLCQRQKLLKLLQLEVNQVNM